MTPRRTLGTIPNLISVSRVALAAGFVASSATELRVGIIGAAAITDFLDGWIARRARVTSRWGAMIDPIADRFFVLTVVATMLFTGMISTGAYFVLISRDLATAVGFLVAKIIPWLRGVTFQARMSGKVVTVLQLITLVSVLVLPVATPWLRGTGRRGVGAVDRGLHARALARPGAVSARRRGPWGAAVLMTAALAAPLHAQQPRARLVPEVRVDAIGASPTTVQGAVGVEIPAGCYVRVGVLAGAGASVDADESGAGRPAGRAGALPPRSVPAVALGILRRRRDQPPRAGGRPRAARAARRARPRGPALVEWRVAVDPGGSGWRGASGVRVEVGREGTR